MSDSTTAPATFYYPSNLLLSAQQLNCPPLPDAAILPLPSPSTSVIISPQKELEKTGKGKRIINFNAMIEGIVIVGFRIIDGKLFPPSSKIAPNRWIKLIYMDRRLAAALYEEVATKFHDIVLKEGEEAIGPLLLSDEDYTRIMKREFV